MSFSSSPEGNPSLGLLLAESHVLMAVAGDTVLHGQADELMRRLGVGPGVFRAALQDLVAGGWIFATLAKDGRLRIGRERRSRDAGPPDSQERRRSASLWEGQDASFDT